jgi:uncharacterized protein
VQVSPHHKRPFGTPELKQHPLLFELIPWQPLFEKGLMIQVGPDLQGTPSTTNPKYEAPGWDQIYDMLLTLAKMIKKSGYKPDVIVGVSRGGWPPARIMSDLLENPHVANMRVEFYEDIGVRSRKPRITQPVTADVTGRKVLVVDDVADTGHSLKAVTNHLRRMKTSDVKVCTIYMKPQSIFRPDFYARSTKKWIIFPWERLEAVRLISRKNKAAVVTVSSIARQLKGSGISGDLVKRIWSVLSDD